MHSPHTRSGCSVSGQLRWPEGGRKAQPPEKNTEGFLMLYLEPVPRSRTDMGREDPVAVVRGGNR